MRSFQTYECSAVVIVNSGKVQWEKIVTIKFYYCRILKKNFLSAVPIYKTEEGELTAAAVCASSHLDGKNCGKLEFVLAWDMPRIHFKSKGYLYFR